MGTFFDFSGPFRNLRKVRFCRGASFAEHVTFSYDIEKWQVLILSPKSKFQKITYENLLLGKSHYEMFYFIKKWQNVYSFWDLIYLGWSRKLNKNYKNKQKH